MKQGRPPLRNLNEVIPSGGEAQKSCRWMIRNGWANPSSPKPTVMLNNNLFPPCHPQAVQQAAPSPKPHGLVKGLVPQSLERTTTVRWPRTAQEALWHELEELEKFVTMTLSHVRVRYREEGTLNSKVPLLDKALYCLLTKCLFHFNILPTGEQNHLCATAVTQQLDRGEAGLSLLLQGQLGYQHTPMEI